MGEVDTFLTHYGVIGMKWGVRKDERAVRKGRLAKDEFKKIRKDYQRNYSQTWTKEYNKLGGKELSSKMDRHLDLINNLKRSYRNLDSDIAIKSGNDNITKLESDFKKLESQNDYISGLASKKAGKKHADYILNKYGQDKADRYVKTENYENAKDTALAISIAAGTLVGIGLLAYKT